MTKCYHLKQTSGKKGWVCNDCGEPVAVKKKPFDGCPTVFCAGDANDIDQAALLRDERHGTKSGWEVEKEYYSRIQKFRRKKRDGELVERDGARMTGSIPSELFWAKRKLDSQYWNDPKNVQRHKDWMI